MKFAKLFVAVACLVLATSQAALAQRSAASKSLGDDYYFYRSEAYGTHADAQAYVLNDYARAAERVPTEVIEEHTGAIRSSIQGAQRGYQKVSDTAKKHPEASKSLAAIEAHYKSALAALDKLEADEVKEAGDPKVVAEHSAEIQKLLKQVQKEHEAILKALKIQKPAKK